MNDKMPTLTIKGKRDIVKLAVKVLGEKYFLQLVAHKEIPSLRYMNENIRKYKTKFFQHIWEEVSAAKIDA